jgi:hypothetical protein
MVQSKEKRKTVKDVKIKRKHYGNGFGILRKIQSSLQKSWSCSNFGCKRSKSMPQMNIQSVTNNRESYTPDELNALINNIIDTNKTYNNLPNTNNRIHPSMIGSEYKILKFSDSKKILEVTENNLILYQKNLKEYYKNLDTLKKKYNSSDLEHDLQSTKKSILLQENSKKNIDKNNINKFDIYLYVKSFESHINKYATVIKYLQNKIDKDIDKAYSIIKTHESVFQIIKTHESVFQKLKNNPEQLNNLINEIKVNDITVTNKTDEIFQNTSSLNLSYDIKQLGKKIDGCFKYFDSNNNLLEITIKENIYGFQYAVDKQITNAKKQKEKDIQYAVNNTGDNLIKGLNDGIGVANNLLRDTANLLKEKPKMQMDVKDMNPLNAVSNALNNLSQSTNKFLDPKNFVISNRSTTSSSSSSNKYHSVEFGENGLNLVERRKIIGGKRIITFWNNDGLHNSDRIYALTEIIIFFLNQEPPTPDVKVKTIYFFLKLKGLSNIHGGKKKPVKKTEKKPVKKTGKKPVKKTEKKPVKKTGKKK